LTGVTGTASNDVWEVGGSFHSKRSLGYALHWDGSAWTSYKESNPSTHGGQFSGVAELAPNDIWTVGVQYLAAGYGQPQSIIEHWNGSGFAVVPAPQPQQFTVLYGVTAFGSSDVWAVGGSQSASSLEQSYLVRWGGSGWTQVPSPNVAGMSTNLDAVAGSSANDVWSVGDYYGNPSSNYGTLAEHWDGASWSIVPTPNVTGHSGRLNSVVALSATDAWAVGEYVNGTKLAPLTEHWDGSAWSIVPSPDPDGGSVFLLGTTAVSAHDVWAVGEISRGPKIVATYTMRWNGTSWRIVKSPNVHGRPVTLLNAVATIPRAGIWAVGGDASLKAVFDTVTERYACSKETLEVRR
jgi:hypothetical protein